MTMRRRSFLGALAALPVTAAPARNMILFTSDGLRWQDVFRGIDPAFMGAKQAGMDQARHLRDRFWRESPDERRAALMPFFWGTLARQGAVSDNVRVTNAYRVSYPGYSEILTGRAQDEVIRGNEPKQNPVETVLEYLRRKQGLTREQVAVFGSWNAFQWMSESKPGTLTINAGYADSKATPRIEELSRMQHQIMTADASARHDWITFEMALDYMKTVKPRVLYIAFNETDEWAHEKRYDRYLLMANYVDQCLERLWKTAESIPEYRGSTALVATADHGRGAGLDDWSSHGPRVDGAERIWLAAMAPEKPVLPPAMRQRDVAALLLRLMGLDPAGYASSAQLPSRDQPA